MDAGESHGRARTARLWRSDGLTNEVKEPQRGARTAERGHNQPALTNDPANSTAQIPGVHILLLLNRYLGHNQPALTRAPCKHRI